MIIECPNCHSAHDGHYPCPRCGWPRESECICKPVLDGGTMPRPKDIPPPLNFDPDCPVHGDLA